MNDLFEQSGDMKDNLFEYLSYIFDPVKNAELIRQAELEAASKCICKRGYDHAINRICQKCKGIIPIRHYSRKIKEIQTKFNNEL